MRIAPSGGYDFTEKGRYRKELWSYLAHACDRPARAVVMLMPSSEGIEIEAALSAGFVEHNVWIVDREPAIVATHKRTYREINTIGVEVKRAGHSFLSKCSGGDRLTAANLDLTGSVGNPLLSAVSSFAASGALAPVSLVAVTCLRGRESGRARELVGLGHERGFFGAHMKQSIVPAVSKWATDLDCGRLGAIWVAMSSPHLLGDIEFVDEATVMAKIPYVLCVAARQYASGSQTMLWSLWLRVEMVERGEGRAWPAAGFGRRLIAEKILASA